VIGSTCEVKSFFWPRTSDDEELLTLPSYVIIKVTIRVMKARDAIKPSVKYVGSESYS
jgi:hypothetical protein